MPLLSRIIQSDRKVRFRSRRPQYEKFIDFITCCFAIRNSRELDSIILFLKKRIFCRRICTFGLRFTRLIKGNNTGLQYFFCTTINRKLTEACQTKARRRKRTGTAGRTSIIGLTSE
jgi:hypothetical protein